MTKNPINFRLFVCPELAADLRKEGMFRNVVEVRFLNDCTHAQAGRIPPYRRDE
jgi:hypothetical protein